VSALQDGNPEYKAVKIFKVDWDTFKSAPISDELNIKRRSTLVMFKGGEEIGRVISQTSAEDIEPLFAKVIAG